MNAIQPVVDGTTLIFSSADGVVQRVPLVTIVLIGERTDVGGAYIEDYW